MQYIDTLSISMRDFYAKTGISRGTLESDSSITEVTLAKFIAFYPEINPTWLLTGTGRKFVEDVEASMQTKLFNDSISHDIPECEMCKMKDKLIQSQDKQIETLSKFISHLEKNT